MTRLYFIRHCQSDITIHDELSRPLTLKGLEDRCLVNRFLDNKNITYLYSSPYKRAYDTLKAFAEQKKLPIVIMDELKERAMPGWIEDFDPYAKAQWADFRFAHHGGESLEQVQARSLRAMEKLVVSHPGQNIAIGSHGTALSTLINHYEPAFGYENFKAIAQLMPWAAVFTFKKRALASLEKVDFFNL